jgi:aminopeptidase-like protein
MPINSVEIFEDYFNCGFEQLKSDMFSEVNTLFPICRSITGKGVIETLEILGSKIPLKTIGVQTGTKVFDWEIPKIWNIRDAYIKDSKGNRLVDFKKSNLHVISYSIPVNKRMNLSELKPFLHTLPELPDAIPYLTSYYSESWGFCISHNQFMSLEEDVYEVVIDSELKEGDLLYGEFFKAGKKKEIFLVSTYLCHPSLCNDNLSGVVVALALAKILNKLDTEYSYKIIFVPETIGSISFLANNESELDFIKFGLVVTCCGDSGCSTYKKTRDGKTYIDKVVENVLRNSGKEYKIIDFFPTGSDERQYCSPGINLSIGSLMRTPYTFFKEYHTSLDNLDFIKPEFLIDTLIKYLNVIYIIENDKTYINLKPKCEPQLGKYGLYGKIGGQRNKIIENAYRWILNYSDGKHSLLDISNLAHLDFFFVKKSAEILLNENLIKEK